MSSRSAAKRGANGTGSIRERTRRSRNGKQIKYWEGRVTVGFDPGTGKQIQRTVTGKTQKEVREKMQEMAVELNKGTYREPCKLTVGEWLDIWVETYTLNCKERTKNIYKSDIRLHIKPAMGAVPLEVLNPHMVQTFYNDLVQGKDGKPLSPKSVRGVHGVLHEALKQAVMNGYIRSNPADSCTLPRKNKQEIHPFTEQEVAAFLKEIAGNRFEDLFITTMFSGPRQGEVMGLTWSRIDFQRNRILIDRQLQLHQEDGIDAYGLEETKNSKSREVTAASRVMDALRHRKVVQAQDRLMAGAEWNNKLDLVFTNGLGEPLRKSTVYREFKKAAAAIGRPDARFHDLRHTFATLSLHSGDDIKTVQENLGHATAAFTLDIYAHATDMMKKESADRMDALIRRISG